MKHKPRMQTREVIIAADGRVMNEAEKRAFYKERRAKLDAAKRCAKPTAAVGKDRNGVKK